MIYIPIVSVLIFLLSPFLGVAFLTGIGGKYFIADMKNEKIAYIMLIVPMLLLLFKVINGMIFINIIFGLILSSLLFFYTFRKKGFYLGLIYTGLFNFTFSLGRKLMYGAKYEEIVKQFFKQNEALFLQNSTNLSEETFREFLNMLQKIMIDFQITLWTVVIVLAFYIGVLIFAKRNKIHLGHKYIQIPNFMVYLLILTMGLLLILPDKTIVLNLAVSIAVLFLIDGIAVVYYYWHSYFKNKKFLTIVLILLMGLNPYLLTLVALIGISDYWFDYRRLKIQEEKNENNIK